jgi:hypothetical protein
MRPTTSSRTTAAIIRRRHATAVGVLQKAWRTKMRGNELFRLVQRFLSTGIEEKSRTHVNSDQGEIYKELLKHFGRKDVYDSAEALLRRICSLSTRIHGACAVNFRVGGDSICVRVFLTAYTIKTHVSRIGVMCNQVDFEMIKSARVLLSEFNHMVMVILETKSFIKIPKDVSVKFNSDLIQYFKAFRSWEKNDLSSSRIKIRYTLVSLYYNFFFVAQNIPDRMICKSQIDQRRKSMVLTSGQENLTRFDADLSVGLFGIPPIADVEAIETLASDPGFFVMKQLESTILVNEIVTDENFVTTLDFLKESPIHVFSSLSRENGLYWSTLFLDLVSLPQSFNQVRKCLFELKRQIQMMVNERRRAWVDASINIQCDNGSEGWAECVAVLREIVSVIQKVQMPVRDKEMASGWKAFEETISDPEVLIEALQFVHSRVKICEIDEYNEKIILCSGHLNQNGVKRVTEKFKALRDSGNITMERTKVFYYYCCYHCSYNNNTLTLCYYYFSVMGRKCYQVLYDHSQV